MRLASACTQDGYSQYWRILVAPHVESEEPCARSRSSWLSVGIKVDNIKLPWSSHCDGAVQAYQVLAQLGFIRRKPLPTKSISTSAEVVDAKTSVEESPVAEMLVSRVALLVFFVVSAKTEAPTSGTACAEGSNCTHAHIMSPTSEDSSGRHWQPSLKVDSRGCPRLEFMGIRPSLW